MIYHAIEIIELLEELKIQKKEITQDSTAI